MPDYLGDDQRKIKEEEKDDGPIRGTLLKRAYNADWGVFIHRNVGISYLANANLLSTYFNYLFFKNTCVSEWNINVHIVRDMENISFNESCRRKYKVQFTLTTMLTTQRQCHRAQPLMMFFYLHYSSGWRRHRTVKDICKFNFSCFCDVLVYEVWFGPNCFKTSSIVVHVTRVRAPTPDRSNK